MSAAWNWRENTCSDCEKQSFSSTQREEKKKTNLIDD